MGLSCETGIAAALVAIAADAASVAASLPVEIVAAAAGSPASHETTRRMPAIAIAHMSAGLLPE